MIFHTSIATSTITANVIVKDSNPSSLVIAATRTSAVIIERKILPAILPTHHADVIGYSALDIFFDKFNTTLLFVFACIGEVIPSALVEVIFPGPPWILLSNKFLRPSAASFSTPSI